MELVIEPSYGNIHMNYANARRRPSISASAPVSASECGLLQPLLAYVEYMIKHHMARHLVYPNLKDQVIPFFKPPQWANLSKISTD